MNRKLLVINQYYAPDIASTGQLAAEICSSIAAKGVEVHVVAGQPSYTTHASDAPDYEIMAGVHVHRVSAGTRKGRSSFFIRVSGYIRFLLAAKKLSRAIVRVEKPDTIMTFHNPPFVGWIGANLANKHGLNFVYVPYDIHPDILVATKWMWIPAPVRWLWNWTNNYIFKKARTVIALGNGMKDTLVYSKGVPSGKVEVIPLWGRPEFSAGGRDEAMRTELGVGPSELLLLYSGNMGIMHPLEQIMDAAAELLDRPVRFVFTGDGAKRKHLEERASAANLRNVQFLPFQTEERFAGLVAAADACFVALGPGLEKLALPSRSFTFLSAGRPLLTLMSPNADVARLVTEEFCGWNSTSTNELVQQIETLLRHPDILARASQNAARVYQAQFRREDIIGRYHDVIAA